MKANYFTFLIIFMILTTIFLTSCVSKRERAFIDSMEIEFSGKILNITNIDHGCGVLCLKPSSKNFDTYNDELQGYYIVKSQGDYINLIDGLRFAEIDDSISFNSKKNGRLKHFRNDSLISDNMISFLSYNWDYLNDKGKNVDCSK